MHVYMHLSIYLFAIICCCRCFCKIFHPIEIIIIQFWELCCALLGGSLRFVRVPVESISHIDNFVTDTRAAYRSAVGRSLFEVRLQGVNRGVA
jgi:hypothetical protein